MLHEIHKIISFRIIGPFTLEIIFEDNLKKEINFLSVLYGEMYGPLRNPELFNKVVLDNEVHTLVWQNGADFDPALLYHWEKHVKELSERAKKWNLHDVQ